MNNLVKKIAAHLPALKPGKKTPVGMKLALTGQTCRNCGAPLYEKFCAVCGQRHFKGRNPYWEFLEDATDQMISPESKLWRTFFHLLVLPGIMTRNYFKGRRASYAPPIRLYLISLVAFFAALALLDVAVIKLSMVANDSVFTEDQKAEALADIEERIAAAKKQGQPEKLIEVLEEVRANIQNRAITEPIGLFAVQGEAFHYVPNWQMFTPLSEGEEEVDAEAIKDFFQLANPGEAAGFLGNFATRVQNGFIRAAEDPRKLNNSLNIWLPRVMIIFVPMFGIFLRFFYWGRNHFILNQMVFSLHFHTALFFFLTFFLVAQALFGEIAGDAGMALMIWGFPAFMLLSLKNAYGDGWLKTVGKFAIIGIFYAIGVSITLAGVFLVGLAEV